MGLVSTMVMGLPVGKIHLSACCQSLYVLFLAGVSSDNSRNVAEVPSYFYAVELPAPPSYLFLP